MQRSHEGKRAKLWGPRAHFGANISLNKIVVTRVTNYPYSSGFSACLLNRELQVLKGLESVFILAKAYNFLNLGQKPLEFFLAL